MSKKSKRPSAREELLADTLNEHGLLAPLMSVMVEQIEDQEADKQESKPKPSDSFTATPLTAAEQIVKEHYPELYDDEIRELGQEF